MYSILWLHEAEISYYEELDFIYEKWNIIEVENFIGLVYDFLEILSKKTDYWNLFKKVRYLFNCNFEAIYFVLQNY
ncbi:hypothetical protein [Flavobacterium tegetincola]|uniref:hypothetical protein n=1 Tax=Flavobacterium tegetincola TaxID=150172 RepID=UPI000402BC48|nr:hypothetical protein [Flavobacterium tegetincola]